jgi:hypothetical protein
MFARVLLVAGSIGNDELALWRREVSIRDVDGDALLAFRLQAVSQKREVDRSGRSVHRRLLHRCQLVFVNALRIVEQPPNQRRLTVIHTAGCGKPQELLLLLLLEKRVDGRLRGSAHQK